MNPEFYVILKSLFVTPRNIAIVLSSWGLAWLIGKMIPNAWVKVYKAHVVPAVLLLVCSIGVWLPGLRPGFPNNEELPGTGIDGSEFGWRIGLGVILTVVAYALPSVTMFAAEKWLPEKAIKSIKRIL